MVGKVRSWPCGQLPGNPLWSVWATKSPRDKEDTYRVSELRVIKIACLPEHLFLRESWVVFSAGLVPLLMVLAIYLMQTLQVFLPYHLMVEGLPFLPFFFPFLSFPILSFPFPFLSFSFLSFPFLFCPFLSFPFLSFPVLSCPLFCELKLSTSPTAIPLMWMGVCVSAILLKSTMNFLVI